MKSENSNNASPNNSYSHSGHKSVGRTKSLSPSAHEVWQSSHLVQDGPRHSQHHPFSVQQSLVHHQRDGGVNSSLPGGQHSVDNSLILVSILNQKEKQLRHLNRMRIQTLEDLARKKRKMKRLGSLDILPQSHRRPGKENMKEAVPNMNQEPSEQLCKLRVDF